MNKFVLCSLIGESVYFRHRRLKVQFLFRQFVDWGKVFLSSVTFLDLTSYGRKGCNINLCDKGSM